VSVVTASARRRWVAVAVGVAVLAVLPALAPAAASWVATTRETAAVPAPPVLARRALASASIGYTGLAESRGDLGLPDLPRLEDVAATLGDTTRTRVWWAGSRHWRVDALTGTGERGIYRSGRRTVLWDYEQALLTDVVGAPTVRLPRPDDLQPPQAARRLLAGVGPKDRIVALPGRRRVAGVQAVGIRVTPGDPRSTIGHVDLWLDPVHSLPVEVSAVDERGRVAVGSRFLALDFGAPPASALRVPAAPGAVHDITSAPDLATRIQQFAQWRLPGRLAGLASADPIVDAAATYGSGLVRIVVLTLPRRLSGQVLDVVRAGGKALDVTGGEAVLVENGSLNLVLSRAEDGHGYLVAGFVDPQLLGAATTDLLAITAGLP
jgi:hypothetical protein